MDKLEALALLKQSMAEVPRLRALHHANGEFTQWRNGVLRMLGQAYGLESAQYSRFADAPGKSFIVNTDLGLQQDYEFRLDCYESALRTLIDRAQS